VKAVAFDQHGGFAALRVQSVTESAPGLLKVRVSRSSAARFYASY